MGDASIFQHRHPGDGRSGGPPPPDPGRCQGAPGDPPRHQRGDFDLNLWNAGYFGVDPTDFLWGLYYSKAGIPDNGWNVGRWSNADFDALLDQTYTLDEALFCQMADILDVETPNLMLFMNNGLPPVNRIY